MKRTEQKINMEENFAEEIAEIKNKNARLEKDETTSSSMSKNASADEIGNKEPNAKKRIKFGGWLPDTLDWFKRPELAQTALSTSCYTLNRYCWPKLHGKVKPRIVKTLEFSCGGNDRAILKIDYRKLIPIADINPPEYIIGFEKIHFNYMDNQILEFMLKIVPLLKEDVKISIKSLEGILPISPIGRLMEMLTPPKTNCFCIFWDKDLNDFNRLFHNYFYGLQSIYFYWLSLNSLDLIVKWLTTPRDDGKPKILYLGDFNSNACALFTRIKEEFPNATEPANFFISICFIPSYPANEIEAVIYEIENKTTNEVLALYDMRVPKVNRVLIRYKKEGENTPRVDWEKELRRIPKTVLDFYVKSIPYNQSFIYT